MSLANEGDRRGTRRERCGEDGPEDHAGCAFPADSERAAKRQAGELLAGLGYEGPSWRLRGAAGPGGDEQRLAVCEGLLQQALSGSELADVRFVFDDGFSEVGGHRGVLSCVSEVFAGMFRSDMTESKTGRVRIRGVSRASFRAFLEFAYVGRCGQRVGMADGRELWVLAEAFQVAGLKEWLVSEGVWSMESACAALQYASCAEGSFEGLAKACAGRASWEISGASEVALRGVGAEAAAGLLAAHCGNPRLWRACDVLEGLRYTERWVRANGGVEGVGAGGVERLVELLELNKLPPDALVGLVRPSGLVSDERLLHLSVQGHQALLQQLPSGFSFRRTRTLGGEGPGGGPLRKAIGVAVDDVGGGGGGLVAVTDYGGRCVRVFGVGGELVATIGPTVEGLGELRYPQGVAFNGRGELMVTDCEAHCIHVFGGGGWGYQRSIGRAGGGRGELAVPTELAVSPEGHVIVTDQENHRVQVLRGDGGFVRAFGCKGGGPGQLDTPAGVAVGADGSVVVVDQGNARVQVFDPAGRFVRAFGGRGRGPGGFDKPFGVGVLPHGQILVSDWGRRDVQVFTWEGRYLWSIGKEGGSRVEVDGPHALAVDKGGGVWIACNSARRVLRLERA